MDATATEMRKEDFFAIFDTHVKPLRLAQIRRLVRLGKPLPTLTYETISKILDFAKAHPTCMFQSYSNALMEAVSWNEGQLAIYLDFLKHNPDVAKKLSGFSLGVALCQSRVSLKVRRYLLDIAKAKGPQARSVICKFVRAELEDPNRDSGEEGVFLREVLAAL